MTQERPWVVLRDARGDYQVIPISDSGGHETSVLCACGPTTVTEEAPFVVVHNAFDHREIIEQAEEVLQEQDTM